MNAQVIVWKKKTILKFTLK